VEICRDNNNYEVRFVDSDIISVGRDCFEDPSEKPPGFNSDCIREVAYNDMINSAMPFVVSNLGGNSSCEDGYISYTSVYSRELCQVPCITDLNGELVIEIKDCGESTACCIKLKSGVLTITKLSVLTLPMSLLGLVLLSNTPEVAVDYMITQKNANPETASFIIKL